MQPALQCNRQQGCKWTMYHHGLLCLPCLLEVHNKHLCSYAALTAASLAASGKQCRLRNGKLGAVTACSIAHGRSAPSVGHPGQLVQPGMTKETQLTMHAAMNVPGACNHCLFHCQVPSRNGCTADSMLPIVLCLES